MITYRNWGRRASVLIPALTLLLMLALNSTTVEAVQIAHTIAPVGVWSPMGNALAIADVYQLRVFQADRATPLMLPIISQVTTAAFSSDGILLATWDRAQVLQLWSTDTGELVAEHHLADGYGSISAIRFARNNPVIGFRYLDDTQFLNGKIQTALPTPGAPHPTRTYESGIYLWDYPSDQLTNIVVFNSRSLGISGETGFFMSPDGAVGGVVQADAQNRTGRVFFQLHFYQLDTGQQLVDFGGYGTLQDFQYDPRGNMSGTALLGDGEVHFWHQPQYLDNLSPNQDFSLTVLPHRVQAIAYNLSGQLLATGGVDGKVRVWNAFDGTLIAMYPNQYADVHQLIFTDDSQPLAFGDPLSYPRVWNAVTLETVSDFRVQELISMGNIEPTAVTEMP